MKARFYISHFVFSEGKQEGIDFFEEFCKPYEFVLNIEDEIVYKDFEINYKLNTEDFVYIKADNRYVMKIVDMTFDIETDTMYYYLEEP